MSDLFYSAITLVGRHVFFVNSVPVVIGVEHTRRRGAYLLASNHQSPYDVPLIMRHARRRVDFVSIVEVFAKPLVGWFYGAMNAFPLDRGRPDAKTVRVILDRLERGRVVGIFPEGGFRIGRASVVLTGRLRPGIGRLSRLAGVPVLPCVVIGSETYGRFTSWLPLRRVRYGIIFGEPIPPSLAESTDAQMEARLCRDFSILHGKLAGELGYGIAENG